jgi:tetratricopeptide (TPR) repeat protein
MGVLLALVVVGGSAAGYYWWKRNQIPSPGSERYEEYVEAFQIGTAALDSGVIDIAEQELTKAIDLVPKEPAGWANRGLTYLRSQRLDSAKSDFTRAEQQAPENADIQKLLGLVDEAQGHFSEAVNRFRKAIAANPQDVQAVFHLGELINRDNPLQSEKEYAELLDRILADRPDNLFILSTRARMALDKNDHAALKDYLARFEKYQSGWDEKTRAAFVTAKQSLAKGDDADMHGFLNVLRGEAAFRRGSGEVSPQEVGAPLRTFVKMTPIQNHPSPPDLGLTFSAVPLPEAPAGKWDAMALVWANDKPALFVLNGKELRPVGSGTPLSVEAISASGLIALDWNNDSRSDLFAFGVKGVRFFQQQADGKFADATAKTGLPAETLGGNYIAALAIDFDLDGDLDILLAPRSGPPIVIRNNFDGAFKIQPFPGPSDVRCFAWADLDHDGAPDLAMIDAKGKMHIFANERSGRFIPWPAAIPEAQYQAVAIADVNDDGVLDLVALRQDGGVLRISDKNKRAAWDSAEIAKWNVAAAEPGTVRLFAADLDNNGVVDIVASSPTASVAWLGSVGGKFETLPAALPSRIAAIADLDNTGRLDLLALAADGKPLRFKTTATKNYHWQTIRFRAQPVVRGSGDGDNRINSFGIGGDIEIRAGSFVVKQPIDSPMVHFGLGDRSRCDVMRVVWPNGGAQVEFRKPADTVVQADQRLKGSCPFLFAWNGERFAFVADFMWSSPLGMYINSQEKGAVPQTSEWIRIRGDQLVPKDGRYELRINANLWETHFFDHLALHVVDHPIGTEMYCDERLALEPFTPAFHLMEPPRPVARATDHKGQDATEAVRAVDGVYLDRAGRGRYQGVTGDHWVEIDLGDGAPDSGPVWLIAHGWVHPTDSSINFALEQGSNERPRGLTLEVPNGTGGWKPVRTGIGFPAGKNKTVLVRLDGLDGPGVSRRCRLRTNMEIYWDALHFAKGSSAEFHKKELAPVAADLRFRGILAMSQANASSPELPDYDRIVGSGQPWRDLIGYHTRFGDIRELIEKVDDRYAILTAGDDIALRFAALPDPPAGWKRDFVWVSDGWEKDGDLNTRHGKTVLPLPWHGMPSYETPPGRLENDPIHRRFKKDWDVFHTRFVAPTGFERGLRLP